jgi:hypothetical protein
MQCSAVQCAIKIDGRRGGGGESERAVAPVCLPAIVKVTCSDPVCPADCGSKKINHIFSPAR